MRELKAGSRVWASGVAREVRPNYYALQNQWCSVCSMCGIWLLTAASVAHSCSCSKAAMVARSCEAPLGCWAGLFGGFWLRCIGRYRFGGRVLLPKCLGGAWL